jgi:hypothetical protein
MLIIVIEAPINSYDAHIYKESIQPHLEANLFRPRILAVKKEADDRRFRQKVLGRALSCMKSNPNLVWIFLPDDNVDAFVCSQEGPGKSEGAVVVAVHDAVVGSKRNCC